MKNLKDVLQEGFYQNVGSPIEEILNKFKSSYDKLMYCDEDGHFYLKATDFTEKDIHKDNNLSSWSCYYYVLRDLIECGLGDKYMCLGTYTIEDSTSRINGDHKDVAIPVLNRYGMLWNDSKEARSDMRKYRFREQTIERVDARRKKFNVYTIKEIFNIIGHLYRADIRNIRFIGGEI